MVTEQVHFDVTRNCTVLVITEFINRNTHAHCLGLNSYRLCAQRFGSGSAAAWTKTASIISEARRRVAVYTEMAFIFDYELCSSRL